ncbi:hypothetical protein D3C86_1678260 [compost metagenome]
MSCSADLAGSGEQLCGPPGSSRLEAFKYDLSACLAAFQQLVRALEVGRIDRAKDLGQRRADLPRLDQLGDFSQDVALHPHVHSLHQGAHENRFKVNGDALPLERVGVEHLGVVDVAVAPLRRYEFHDVVAVLDGAGCRKDEARRANA